MPAPNLRTIETIAHDRYRLTITSSRCSWLFSQWEDRQISARVLTKESRHALITDAWRQVYRDAQTYWDLYELAEKLVDLECRFHLWRFSHMKTVERIIGARAGTGGTSGVAYLQKALELRFYPELWGGRTEI